MGVVREFVDQSGLPWRVYAVDADPTHPTALKYLPPSYQQGWLAFESPRHKLRLAPVPGGWAHADVATLQGYLSVASHARPLRSAASQPAEQQAPSPGR